MFEQFSTSSNDIWICNAVLEERYAKQNNNSFGRSNMVAITVSHCTSLVFWRLLLLDWRMIGSWRAVTTICVLRALALPTFARRVLWSRSGFHGFHNICRPYAQNQNCQQYQSLSLDLRFLSGMLFVKNDRRDSKKIINSMTGIEDGYSEYSMDKM